MQDFRKLEVWKLAHQLTLEIYRSTDTFPRGERFGLTQQLRAAAVSIGSNLAEGCGRSTTGDFRRFVDQAAGAARKLEYRLLLTRDLDYLSAGTHERLEAQVQRVQRMLRGLRRRVA